MLEREEKKNFLGPPGLLRLTFSFRFSHIFAKTKKISFLFRLFLYDSPSYSTERSGRGYRERERSPEWKITLFALWNYRVDIYILFSSVMFRIRAVILFFVLGASRDADAVWEPATSPSGPTRLKHGIPAKLHTFWAPNWAWEKRWWPNDEKTIYWIHLSFFFSWPHRRSLSLFKFFYQSNCDTSANLLYCVKGGKIYISIQKSFDCCSAVRREIIEMKLEIYEGNREVNEFQRSAVELAIFFCKK